MKWNNAILSRRIMTIKQFAKYPVRLSNGKLAWLKPYYEEVYYFSNGFGYSRLTSYYYSRDEYIMNKLSGVE